MTFVGLPRLLDEVSDLGQLFTDAGYRLFLVGGIVRDQWLDRPLKEGADIDLTTDARPEVTRGLLEPWASVLWTQGERFGTIGAQRSGQSYEVTTFRAEVYRHDSRKPQVEFGDTIEGDLARRDFTVNAMAIELPHGELIDPFHGANDLSAARLATPLAATVSFSDDPLRMLRAARFANAYELRPDDDVLSAAREMGSRLSIVSVERIHDELRKLLAAEHVDVGLDFLDTTGLLTRVLPEVEDLRGSISRASRLPPPWWLRLAGLGHPSGSSDEDGVLRLAKRLRCSSDTIRSIRTVATGANALLAVVGDANLQDRTLRAWLANTPAHRDEALALARVLDPSQVAPIDAFEEAWHDLDSREDLTSFDPVLTGEQVMATLDVETGPVVGEAMAFLRKRRIDLGPQTATDELQALGEWHAGD